MGESLIDKIIYWSTLLIVSVIVTGGLYLAYRPWRRSQELQRKDQELVRLIELKKAEIARLKDYQRRFREDPDFVERIARQNRRVFPGELVFIFED